MVCGGQGEEVGDGAPETAARLSESEGGSHSPPIGRAASEASVSTGGARTTRHLEGHEDSITRPTLSNLLADGNNLGNGLVTEGKRSGEEPDGSHGKVEIAPRHRERPHDGASRIGHDGVRLLSPLYTAGLDERQLAHEARVAGPQSPD